MTRFLIDPTKWVKVGELELEQGQLYWFEKVNGQIVMGSPYSGYSSGIADVVVDGHILKIITGHFHIVRGG